MSDNTKSADPLPWIDQFGTRIAEPGTDTLVARYAPRPEFGFTEGKTR